MSPETQMILGLVIGVVTLIVLVLKTKVHAFLALIVAAVINGANRGDGTGYGC